MAFDKDAAKRVLAQIDRNELAQVGCDLASIPSPTGQEKAVAEYILAWFAANGLKAVRQDVAPDRPNAVGVLKGDGTGLSLGFNGHTDTSFTGTSADLRMVANAEPDAGAHRPHRWRQGSGSWHFEHEGRARFVHDRRQGAEDKAAFSSRATSSSPAWSERFPARRSVRGSPRSIAAKASAPSIC